MIIVLAFWITCFLALRTLIYLADICSGNSAQNVFSVFSSEKELYERFCTSDKAVETLVRT